MHVELAFIMCVSVSLSAWAKPNPAQALIYSRGKASVSYSQNLFANISERGSRMKLAS